MVKIKVNVKTKNDSIPSDTTKRKMPIVVDPKLHPHPRYHDTNVGDIRFRIKTTKKDTVKELFYWHHVLTGSCEQGRLSFCINKGIDIEKDSFTIYEFIELTKESYNGDIIKKLL